ncbi:Fur family transcriptional regulator [Frankia canadensis]|uniref:Fur family transcriptional regulator n=1 Tax=Frankia canadensis TaxID=1836972 RepID=A0A2I2KZX4_9ACTN|nr:transcriptional repressor [Frankia canadensis]SNQ51222.1 Fur family transcriptional regulator [Frankia canadensis]SOU58512.1 Fur family transcriptional regulator [Frankia canadensis]
MTDQTDLRLTPQRMAVLEVLRAADDHPTAAEVYERVRRASPGIGSATVYRTLALLVSTGRALELTLGDGAAARYDANTRRHDHAVCDGCGRAVDLDHPVPDGMMAEIARRSGFAITGYDLQFRGLCPDCQGSDRQTTPSEGALHAEA